MTPVNLSEKSWTGRTVYGWNTIPDNWFLQLARGGDI